MLAALIQESAPQAVPEDVFPTLLSVLAAVIVGGIIIYLVRNWARRSDDSMPGFTLGDLRELRENGEITEAEFKAARNAMISQVRDPSSPTQDGGSLDDRRSSH
ncbi:MAG: hypothetical protein FJ285_08595 [Planctomycetes bacterium]|nr:hypothetical protein [Planctomycetota bacterium]